MVPRYANYAMAFVLGHAVQCTIWYLHATVGLLLLHGGLFSMIMLGLYPILLFNKSFGRVKRDYSITRNFNWALFGGLVAVGGFGTYTGIRLIGS